MAETLFIANPSPEERNRILTALSAETLAAETYSVPHSSSGM